MCLLVLAYRVHPHYPLVIAANRDEFYARPTRPLDVWEDDANIVAGRDLQEGGTWMGISRQGRLAALTNFREPGRHVTGARSRGHLVSEFLKGHNRLNTYIRNIESNYRQYNGFNLLLSNKGRWVYMSNRGAAVRFLKPGIHGLSNHLLNSPWPKIKRSCGAVEMLLTSRPAPRMEAFMRVLQDRTIPPDRELPDTGVGIEWERRLGAVFIHTPIYGTRASTVLIADGEGTVRIRERSFDVGGMIGEVEHTLEVVENDLDR
jgi:uncharacterized protein with NRDE domain